MIELIILWAYILIFNYLIGNLVLRLIDKVTIHDKEGKHSFMAIQLSGVVSIAVYAQIVSILGRVYAFAHILLLIVALITLFIPDLSPVNEIRALLKKCISWEFLLGFILVVITAFFASRGVQHRDTYIYHAEMIRWYEEYGLITGMGNLQNHFAYNSSSMAYAAFFSMRWLLGQSLHGTNGFFQAIMVAWAVIGLTKFKERSKHLVDAGFVATVVYAIVNAEYIMSPASDFSSMYLVLWIAILWLENISKIEVDIHNLALISVAVCFATSSKLSVGMLVVIAIYPAVMLIRTKKIKSIFIYLGLGIIVLLPWVIRNIIISGCVIYPVEILRLPFLDWTIPSEYLAQDRAGIATWGNGLYDRNLADASMRVWLPVWWRLKDTYEKMLIESILLSFVAEVVWIIYGIIRREKLNWAYFCLKIAILLSAVIWFVEAPAIRYGLAFLLLIPLIEVFQWINDIKSLNLVSIIVGFLCAGIILDISIYINYYALYDTNLAKKQLLDPYYLVQKDYEKVEYQTYDMDGLTIYYPQHDEDNSYAPIPSTAYINMAERTKLRGDSLKDGFMPR